MDAIFVAVLDDNPQLARLLDQSPRLAQRRMSADFLVEAVPHMLYRGDTPLHLAGAALKVAAARQLLECGAEVNAENRRGALALHYACDPRPNAGTWDPESQVEVIQLLLQHGADPATADERGRTPFDWATNARIVAALQGES